MGDFLFKSHLSSSSNVNNWYYSLSFSLMMSWIAECMLEMHCWWFSTAPGRWYIKHDLQRKELHTFHSLDGEPFHFTDETV